MIKRLFSYAGEYKKYVFLAPLFVILETAGELALPLLIAKIIDDGILMGNLPMIYRIGIYMVIMAIAAVFLGAYGAKFGSYGSIGIGANLRQAEFRNISRFSFADIDYFSSASLVTRLTNDVTNVQNFVMMMIRMLWRTLAQIIVSLVVLFTMQWQLALILVASIPVIGVAIAILMTKCHPLFELMQKKIDELNEKVQENLVGIRVVKAFVREDYEEEKFQQANDAFTHAGLKAVLTIVLQQPIMMMGITIVTGLVLYFGGQMVLGGTLAVGTLSSIVTYIFNILISIMMIAMVLLQYVRASACAERIFEVIDKEPSIEDGEDAVSELPASAGQVEFRHVNFKYKAEGSGDDVLHDINFVARPGQTVAIVGGTGVGKSSLVNLIPRFYDVTGGKILVDGQDIQHVTLRSLRHEIGIVQQEVYLFSGTVAENIAYGKPGATREEIVEAARLAGAERFIRALKDGFDTYVGERGVKLSGGQKQRIAIARVFLKNPPILILDEATSALDNESEILVGQSLEKLAHGRTTLTIAHRLTTIKNYDRILVLGSEGIVESGTHDELLAKQGVYYRLWNQLPGEDTL